MSNRKIKKFWILTLLLFALFPHIIAGAEKVPLSIEPPPSRILNESALPGVPFCLSPNGKWIAAFSGSTIYIYDQNGRLAQTLNGHGNTVHGVAFSPDSKKLASASYDDSVRLWNVETGLLIRIVGTGPSDFEGVAISPDGKLIAAVNDDKNVYIWPFEGGDPVKLPEGLGEYQKDITFSPDGKKIVSSYKGVIIWDTAKLSQIYKIESASSPAVYSPLGDVMATYNNTKVTIRNPDNGSIIREFGEEGVTVSGVAISPTGPFLAEYSQSNEVLIWDYTSASLLLRLPHNQNVAWMAFQLPNGLLTFSDKLRVWNWDETALTDNDQRRILMAYYNGQNEHYATYINKYLSSPPQNEGISYSGSKAGYTLVKITDRNGITIQAVDVAIGDKQPTQDLIIPVKIGATSLNLQLKKIKQFQVEKVENGVAKIKFILPDNSFVNGTMNLGQIKGRFAYGDFTYDLNDVTTMSFDFSTAAQKQEPHPAVEDAPYRATIIDSEGGEMTATDLEIGGGYSGVKHHFVQIYLGLFNTQFNFNAIRRMEIIGTPKGGVIARMTMADNRQLVGFIANTTIQGKSAFGDFSLNLNQAVSITFK